MGLFRRRFGGDDADHEHVDLNERSPVTGLRYGDIAILGQLIELGADLDEPRHAMWFVHLPDHDAATLAAARAADAGFEVDVLEPGEPSPDWTVVCGRDVVLSPGLILETDALLEGIAAELGGRFDGWEAAV